MFLLTSNISKLKDFQGSKILVLWYNIYEALFIREEYKC